MKAQRILIFLLVILALSVLAILYPRLTGQVITSTNQQTEYPKETAILNRVIDGDTIEVTGNEIGNKTHIRLLGINTPEKKMPFCNEAANFLKQFVNKTIILQRDFTNKDMYGRSLRYIFYNDSMVNLQILENGFANTYYLDKLKYEKELIEAEAQAKTQEKGIWTKSAEECASCIYLKELNYKEEFFTIGNNCSFSCNLTKWFVKDAGRNTFYLSNLNSQEEKTFNSKNSTNVWNDEGDRLFLFDKNGKMVTFYEYFS